MAIDALLDRCMGDAATVRLILDEFEPQARGDLAEITRLAKCGDCAQMARVAHALKGASGMVSAEALADVALELERIGKAGVFSDQDQLLNQLDHEVRRCLDYLPTVRAALAKTSVK